MRVATQRAALLAVLGCGLCAGASGTASAGSPTINHVFVILLENKTYDKTFGSSPGSPYLARTLPSEGALLERYYGIGHLSLPNYIALASGQPPNTQTQADCNSFSNMFPGSIGADGIVLGQGCVYPAATQTIANQLDSDGLSWRAYAQDMANSVSAGQAASCRHPTVNGQDNTQSAKANDQYAARHVPFLYFHSIIDTTSCATDVVDLNQLPGDLKQESRTPNYSFIVPDLCADGHDPSCPDGSPGGYDGIDRFLREWVPRITGSLAYEDRGLLLITFDEAGGTIGEEDQSACCNEQPGPNTPNPGGPFTGPGGGRVGAVALSPCIQPGTVSDHAYNHYSQLRWIEDNFGLTYLGYAGQQDLKSFGSDVFTQPGCEEQPQLKVRPRHPRAAKRTVFHFRVDSPLRRCKQGVRIGFAGKHRKTNVKGKARIAKRFAKAGVHVARARTPGCDLARKRVRIKRAR
ncbi:MAG: alkaline phosphatase family protein [Actinomycetota bacterium]|nr:alkaline phosphatase family protein [Actinomycetota bacterium]